MAALKSWCPNYLANRQPHCLRCAAVSTAAAQTRSVAQIRSGQAPLHSASDSCQMPAGPISPAVAFWLGDWLTPDAEQRRAALQWYRWQVRRAMIDRAIRCRRIQPRRHFQAFSVARVRTAPRADSRTAAN